MTVSPPGSTCHQPFVVITPLFASTYAIVTATLILRLFEKVKVAALAVVAYENINTAKAKHTSIFVAFIIRITLPNKNFRLNLIIGYAGTKTIVVAW
jgi:hypothetical protein